MTEEQFKKRTAQFAVDVIRFGQSLPRRLWTRVIEQQIIRSGTSVGANYRSACRARSRSDMISKLGISLEEADESLYWLEILVAAGGATEEATAALRDEGNQIASMLSRSINTLRGNTVRERQAHYGASESGNEDAIRFEELPEDI